MILGKLGHMVDVACPSAERVDRAHLSSVFTSMGGYTSRQVAQWRSPRVWALSWGARDLVGVGPVQALVDAYGPGPFQFRPVHAANLNLLTPEVAVLDPRGTDVSGSRVVSLGPVRAGDGVVLHRQVTRPDVGSVLLGLRASGDWILTPLRAGKAVTVSVYARGAGSRLRVFWTDASGAWLSQSYSPLGVGSDGEYRRHVLTEVPPVGAVACRIEVRDCTGAACAAITETPDVKPWAPGEGVAQVSISQAASTDLVAAWGGVNLGGLSIQITEDMV